MLGGSTSLWTSERIAALPQSDAESFKAHIDKLGVLSGIAQKLNGPITSIEKILAVPADGAVTDGFALNAQTLLVYCVSDGAVDDVSLPPLSPALSAQLTSSAPSSSSGVRPVGFIKYARRHLFFYTPKGKVFEADPVCILDFYVQEDQQRRGLGRKLMDAALRDISSKAAGASSGAAGRENVDAAVEADRLAALTRTLAYDRPSPKLLSFMQRHYGLQRPDHQPNKFTVFEGFMQQS